METVQYPVLPIRESIRFGWETFKKQPFLFALAVLIVDCLGFVLEYLGVRASFGDPTTILLVIVVAVAAIAAQMIIMTNFMLRAHDAPESVDYSDLLRPAHFWKLLGTMVLSTIVILIGLILLIVPGVILALILAFAGYIAVDKGLAPVAAMKESARITKGNRLRILGMGGIFLLLGVGAGILGGIGYAIGGDIVERIVQVATDIVLLPLVGLSVVHAYRLLDQAHTTDLGPAAPVAPVPAAEAVPPPVVPPAATA